MARFVLVRGSWFDAAAWTAVAARLGDAGHNVATQISPPTEPTRHLQQRPASRATPRWSPRPLSPSGSR
jgi:hypothetical protein